MGEEGHWYDPITGKLVLAVPYKDPKRAGEFHPPTLREARPLRLRPSTTTVQQLLANPILNQWSKMEVARAAARLPKGRFDDEQLYIQSLLEASDEYRDWAANFGTSVHAYVAGQLQGWQADVDDAPAGIGEAFMEWYTNSREFECLESEHTFLAPGGWAGTIDWRGYYRGRLTIADFKTQDFLEVKEANFYEPWAIQEAGYAIGSDHVDHDRLSIVISRSVPGLVATHTWPREEVERKWDPAWLKLWDLWKTIKGYDPIAA